VSSRVEVLDPPRREVDHVLGDVRDPIPDALEVVRREQDSRAPLDVRGVLAHELDDIGEHALVQVVDLVVARRDSPGQRLVNIDEGARDASDEVRGDRAHRGEVGVRPKDGLIRELPRLLRDVPGVVADAFQLVRHSIEREEESEVARHRLLGRDGRRDQRGRFALGVIHVSVALDDPRRQVCVPLLERPDRLADLALDDRRHPKDLVLDLALAPVEGVAPRRRDGRALGGHQPNRPEM
jgi:hypothetical protein